MKIKTLFMISSILSIIAGMACLFSPSRVLQMYGVALSSMGLVIYQFWGTAMIGVGLLTWTIRNIERPKLQRAFALSLCITYATGTIIAIKGQFVGANTIGWSSVAIYLLLTTGFLVFLVRSFKAIT